MEADSTTIDNSQKDYANEPHLPFTCLPENLMLYKELTSNNGEKSLESQIVERLQTFGLLPKHIECPTGEPDCNLVIKAARVIDRVQWSCEGCKKRQPIRTGSFFMRIQCSILQTLQIILAWCEDADCETAAQHFGVKPRVASTIYDRVEQAVCAGEGAGEGAREGRVGGAGAVVLAELYPDCATRLSPDTTTADAAARHHQHRVLMLADTKHVPTRYYLHVIRNDLKKNATVNNQALKMEIEEVISEMTEEDSILVTGNNVPPIEGASTLQQLVQHCDADMQHFLSTRIWRQAMSLCAASRDLCAGGAGSAHAQCAGAAQRYLHAALYRLRHAPTAPTASSAPTAPTAHYGRVLRLIADHHTDS